MRTEEVISAHNPKFKALLALLDKAASRRDAGLFVVEGLREVEHCLAAGYSPRTLFICPDILPAGQTVDRVLRQAESLNPDCLAVYLPPGLYAKAAYRSGTEGIMAEFVWKEHSLKDIRLSDKPLVIVLESVEKPGNLGAVLRSADAAGADAVIVCEPMTDLFNPNLIRSSIGAVFTVQVASASSAEAIAWLKDKGLYILTAQLQDSRPYYDADMTRGTAIVMGSEATGLSQMWRRAADAHILIPMRGRLDSLNVSVSAAILLYEAVRQREGRL